MASVFAVRDEVWEAVEPLLPELPEQVGPGRRRVPDRRAFNAIVFVMVTGIAWRHVPGELGCSGVTAWRRLLGCSRFGGGTIDAIRLFRGRFIGTGPDR